MQIERNESVIPREDFCVILKENLIKVEFNNVDMIGQLFLILTREKF